MSAASKHRQPRLRASCDGCFLAKVKCSKARPICSRCLACGIECRYSPSSRAGKPKADNSNNHANHNNNSHHHHHHNTTPIQQDMAAVAAGFSPSMMDDKTGLMYAAAAAGVPGLYRLDTGWQTPVNMDVHPGSGAISRNHSISSEMALLAMDESSNAAAMAAAAANGGIYSAGAVPWTTPPTDISVAQFSDSPLSGIPMHGAVHANFSVSPAAATSSGIPWMDPSVLDMFPYGQGQQQMHGPSQQQHQQHQQHTHYQQQQQQQQQQQMPTPGSVASSSVNNYFPSPSTTPSLHQSPATGHKSVPLSGSSSSGIGGTGGIGGMSGVGYHSSSPASCVCFTACLHALQALHNASTPSVPPFDVVLTLNRNAVEGCSAMLACPRCMRRSGTHTAAMLLATLLGKITSFYKTASQSYFRPAATTTVGGGGSSQGGAVNSILEGQEASSVSAPNTTAPRPQPETSSPTSSTAPFTAAGLGLGVSLGAYQLQGEDGRWLELEILNRELKKLEEVYARFREVCGDVLFEDLAVSKAMIGYLGHTLGAALDLVNHRKEDLQFV